MRAFITLVACAIGALGLAGCSALEGQYFQEGVGNNLYSTDLPKVTEYQNAYLDYLCRQSSPVVAAGGDARCSGELPPAAWPLIVQAGMNDIDQRCDGFLLWLDQKKRGNAAAIAEISAIRTAADFIINANSSVGPRSLAAVAAAFSLATDTFSNLNALLLQVDHTTVQTVVFRNRDGYRAAVRGSAIGNRPDAIHVLRQYLNICMPITIAANINITVTGVQQGIVSPPSLVDPSMVPVTVAPLAPAVIAPVTPRTVIIREDRSKPENPAKPSTTDDYKNIIADYSPKLDTFSRIRPVLRAVCVAEAELDIVSARTSTLIKVYQQVATHPATGKLTRPEIAALNGVAPCVPTELVKNYYEATQVPGGLTSSGIVDLLNVGLPADQQLKKPATIADVRKLISDRRRELSAKLQIQGPDVADQLTLDLARELTVLKFRPNPAGGPQNGQPTPQPSNR